MDKINNFIRKVTTYLTSLVMFVFLIGMLIYSVQWIFGMLGVM